MTTLFHDIPIFEEDLCIYRYIRFSTLGFGYTFRIISYADDDVFFQTNTLNRKIGQDEKRKVINIWKEVSRSKRWKMCHPMP